MSEQPVYALNVNPAPNPSNSLQEFAEWVGGAIVAPGRTLRAVSQRQAIVHALALVLLVVVAGSAGQFAVLIAILGGGGRPGTGSSVDSQAMLLMVEAGSIFGSLIWGPVLWTLTAAGLFGSSWLLGGRGSFIGFWSATGFALVPQLIVAPLSPALDLVAAFGPGWQIMAFVVAVPIWVGAFIWTLGLLVITVHQALGITLARATGSVLLLLVGSIFLVTMLIVVFLSAFVAVFASTS